MRGRKIKAGVTVEAAFLMPLICLSLCGMIIMTLSLFGRVRDYSREVTDKKEESKAVHLIRLETMIEQTIKEGPGYEDGV